MSRLVIPLCSNGLIFLSLRAAFYNSSDLALKAASSGVSFFSSFSSFSGIFKNLNNKYHKMSAIPFGPTFGQLTVGYFNAPRTIGMDIHYKF